MAHGDPVKPYVSGSVGPLRVSVSFNSVRLLTKLGDTMPSEVISTFVGSTTPITVAVGKDYDLDSAADIRVSLSTTNDSSGIFFTKSSLTSSNNEVTLTFTQEEADAFVEGLQLIEIAAFDGTSWRHAREFINIKQKIVSHA